MLNLIQAVRWILDIDPNDYVDGLNAFTIFPVYLLGVVGVAGYGGGVRLAGPGLWRFAALLLTLISLPLCYVVTISLTVWPGDGYGDPKGLILQIGDFLLLALGALRYAKKLDSEVKLGHKD